MSELQTNPNTAVGDLNADDQFHIAQIQHHFEELGFDDPEQSSILLTDELHKGDVVEPMAVMTSTGEPTHILRWRHSKSRGMPEETREDVYIGIQNLGSAALMVLREGLGEEYEWMQDGDFRRIRPRHEALARKVANGLAYPEVKFASHDDITTLLGVVHAAVSARKSKLAENPAA